MNSTEIGDKALACSAFIVKQSKAEQVKLLIWLAHILSTHGRAFYEKNAPVSVRGATQLGAINECVNRILGFVLAELRGNETYPMSVLIEDVFRQATAVNIQPEFLHDQIVVQPIAS